MAELMYFFQLMVTHFCQIASLKSVLSELRVCDGRDIDFYDVLKRYP